MTQKKDRKYQPQLSFSFSPLLVVNTIQPPEDNGLTKDSDWMSNKVHRPAKLSDDFLLLYSSDLRMDRFPD